MPVPVYCNDFLRFLLIGYRCVDRFQMGSRSDQAETIRRSTFYYSLKILSETFFSVLTSRKRAVPTVSCFPITSYYSPQSYVRHMESIRQMYTWLWRSLFTALLSASVVMVIKRIFYATSFSFAIYRSLIFEQKFFDPWSSAMQVWKIFLLVRRFWSRHRLRNFERNWASSEKLL